MKQRACCPVALCAVWWRSCWSVSRSAWPFDSVDPNVPILELSAALPRHEAGDARVVAVDLCLRAGEFALVDSRRSGRVAWLADLCSGLLPLAAGSVRFLGRDWSAMPWDYAAALRGRIGRVFQSGGWIGSINVATN